MNRLIKYLYSEYFIIKRIDPLLKFCTREQARANLSNLLAADERQEEALQFLIVYRSE